MRVKLPISSKTKFVLPKEVHHLSNNKNLSLKLLKRQLNYSNNRLILILTIITRLRCQRRNQFALFSDEATSNEKFSIVDSRSLHDPEH
jgi:hypothetical protein